MQQQFSLHESTVDDTLVLNKHFVPAGYVIISPAKSDTGIDINSGIVILPNYNLNVSKIKITSIELRKGEELIAGKFESNDTIATFNPLNLHRGTEYKVSVSGIVYLNPEPEQQSSIKGFEETWSFITAETDPDYLMERRSTHVTDFARDGSELMQVGDYLYLYGGWTPDSSWNDIYRSSGDLSEWTKLPDAPWFGRHTFGVSKLNSQVFVFGGDYFNSSFDVWGSRDGMNFTSIAPDLNHTIQSRMLYGTCTHNNKIYVLGGQFYLWYTESGMKDVWTTSNGLVWTKIADNLDFLGQNITGSVTSFNGKIWVVGGGYYNHPDTAQRWTNHVYSSPDGVNWTREADAPWAGRQYHDVCVWDNKLWMIGGHRDGKNLSDVWYMNKDGSWTEYTPPNLFMPRHATAVAVYNDKLVLACGNMNNECWVIEKQ